MTCGPPVLKMAFAWQNRPKKAKKATSIAVLGNAAELFEKAMLLSFKPDIVTEMCPCHDPFSLIPIGLTPEEAEKS